MGTIKKLIQFARNLSSIWLDVPCRKLVLKVKVIRYIPLDTAARFFVPANRYLKQGIG